MTDDRGRLVLHPVGFARTPHAEKADAPRQPAAARGVRGTIEILPAYRDGLRDLEGFDTIFVVFGFDRAPPSRSLTVQPPRSPKKRGVFATRSPHRPNPIGISVLRLASIDGTTLHVLDVDLLDETPIYDIKPYLAYTDALPDASAGWLAEVEGDLAPPRSAARERGEVADPRATYTVEVDPPAREAFAFVLERTQLDLGARAAASLALGPEPHAYRRIRVEGDVSVLAIKEWRVVFRLSAPRTITVLKVRSGFSARDLARDDPALAPHRAFVERFGASAAR